MINSFFENLKEYYTLNVVNVRIHQENPKFVFANNTDSNAIESLTMQQQQQQRWCCITEMGA